MISLTEKLLGVIIKAQVQLLANDVSIFDALNSAALNERDLRAVEALNKAMKENTQFMNQMVAALTRIENEHRKN